MSSVNKVIIVGNLGADPDSRETATGQKVSTLSIATSEKFTDKAGDRHERTEWHRVVCWGQLAELAHRYLSKGRKVFVEGKIQTRTWEDSKTGEKRYATEIIARDLVFLDSGKTEDRPQARGDDTERRNGQLRKSVADSKPKGEEFGGDDFGDPIPF